MLALLDTLAALLLTGEADLRQYRGLALTIARGGVAGAQAFLEAARLIGEAGDPASVLDALDASAIDDAGQAAGILVIRCFATVRRDYAAHDEAVSAREALSAAAEPAYGLAGDVLGGGLLDFLVRLVGETVLQLSLLPANQVPIVRVETGISLPAALLAFDLYGDPARDEEIAARNRCGTAMLMPVEFEALSS